MYPATKWINKYCAAAVTLLLVSLILPFVLPSSQLKVQAGVSSCSASVSPSSLQTNSSKQFTFTITNGGSTSVRWAYFNSNTANQTVSSGSSSGWGVNGGGGAQDVTFVDGILTAGNTTTFNITVHSGSSEMGAQAWTVQLSDRSDGSNPTTCDGSPSIAISGQSTPPVSISNVAVSNISNTSATISFTTSRDATSQLDYGLDSNYGSTQNITTPTSSHSYTITGLTTNTTYHYQLSATDSDNNNATTNDATFTTAISAQATSTPGPTSTPIVNTITLPTPTPRPDTQPPSVTISAPPATPYKDTPSIVGSAVDNVEVTVVEYSTDKGKSWSTIKGVTGLNSSQTKFSFVPTLPSDGTWTIQVRAKDNSGNTSTAVSFSITIDRTGPVVTFTTAFDKPFTVSPKISGLAVDASGESSLEYSLDGTNWQPVDSVTINGNQTQFSFTPPPLDDGNYPISIQATDPLGNVSVSAPMTMIIDRLPPKIGGILLSIGSQILQPKDNGFINTIPLVNHLITASIVGGPIEVTATLTDSTTGKKQLFPLSKNPYTGLWSTIFYIPAAGDYTFSLYARDGANNQTQEDVGKIRAEATGIVNDEQNTPVSGTVTLYTQDQTTKTYEVWDGTPFGQTNPKRVSLVDSFNFIPPSGSYYIEVAAPGYQTVETNSFTIIGATPVGLAVHLKKAPSLHLLFVDIPLPTFNRPIIPFTPEQLSSIKTDHATIPFPAGITLTADKDQLSQDTIRTKKSIITLLNTWDPQAAGQLQELEAFSKSHPTVYVAVIFTEEPAARVALYKARGAYTLPMFADPDGNSIPALPYKFTPTNFFFDQSAQSQKQFTGVINDQQMETNL